MSTKRQDTRLEAEGAEFLVLGQLLITGIVAHKTYTNMAGYDLVATDPEHGTSARIQVKSRWCTKPEGFIIKNFDTEFVVLVLLNRGSKDGRAEVRAPEFFVMPVDFVREAHARAATAGWNKLSFSKMPGWEDYRDRWGLVAEALHGKPSR